MIFAPNKRQSFKRTWTHVGCEWNRSRSWGVTAMKQKPQEQEEQPAEEARSQEPKLKGQLLAVAVAQKIEKIKPETIQKT